MKQHRLFFFAVLPLLCLGCAQKGVTFSAQFEDGKLVFHSEDQAAFLKGPYNEIPKYAHGDKELSRPLSSVLTWTGGEAPYTVTIKESAGKTVSFQTNDTSYNLVNLKLDTTYEYSVADRNTVLKEDSFTTEDGIVRNLYVSGVTNVRDVGGYPLNGKRTKQGLLFRGARLNENKTEEVTPVVNEKGKKTLLEDFGIKTEIDLRRVDNNEVGGLVEGGAGVLGEGVAYYQCPMRYDSKMPGILNDNGLRKTFGILGKKENYPIYFHCSIGTDRTGYVSWLINAYLGVEEDYLWKDYLFSNFGNIDGSRVVSSISNGYVQNIKNAQGETLSEKAKTYLLARGVEEAELQVLREMMLGE
ncbi:MAG: tyrosine-protein phosphatase [Bacilli bacterium]|nr:tyrosine-protein phosphatase [Bacilli bacterium]